MHGKQLLSPSQSGIRSTTQNVAVLSEPGDANRFQQEGQKSFSHHTICRNKLSYLRNHPAAPVTRLHHGGEQRLSRSWSTGTNTTSFRSGGLDQSCGTAVDAKKCDCLHRLDVGGLDRHQSSVPDYLLEKLYGADSSTTRPRPIQIYESNSEDS